MKLRSVFRAATAAALVFVASAGVFAQKITPEVKEKVLKEMTEIVTTKAFVPGKDFSKWPEFLAARKEALDKTTDAEAFALEVREALENFGISHIVLMPPKATSMRQTGKIVGIGVSIRPEEKGFRIWDLFPKAPAQEAGLEVGDLIVAVDGKEIKTIEPIAGAPDTQVVITVEKLDGKRKDYHITRREFSTRRPETLTWHDSKTAVIKIPTFDRGYTPGNVEKLMKDALKADKLILDLRGNGGGAVMYMFHLLNMLLPADVEFGTFVTKGMVDAYVKETKKDGNDIYAVAAWTKDKLKTRNSDIKFKGKIAVLVDQGSGSASEIVAAALKETANAPVIGAKSAGAVLASIMAPISNGFMVQYPITDYVTIKGIRLEGNGVAPDLVIPPLAKPGQPDEAIAKAAAVLNGADIKSLQTKK